MGIMKKKMYVLVRKDMPKDYQAVQAGHALTEYVLHDQLQVDPDS